MPGKIIGSCKICSQNNAVYRCPKCFIVYCSLFCYKTHQGQCANPNKCDNAEPKDENEKTNAPLLTFTEEEEAEDRLDVQTLSKLGQSEKLKELLGNHHLKNLLKEIDSSDNPGTCLEKNMNIPIFTEFVDECLKVVEPDEIDDLEEAMNSG